MSRVAEEDTPAYKIFFKRWHCRIRDSEVIPEAVSAVHGIFITGDIDRDKSSARKKVGAIRTIAQLAMMHDEGQRPDILSAKDAWDMYNLIMSHLDECRGHGTGAVWNTQGPPKEDLIVLDKFAQYIFSYARLHFLDTHESANDGWRSIMGEETTTRETKLKANVEHVSRVDKSNEAMKKLAGLRRWK